MFSEIHIPVIVTRTSTKWSKSKICESLLLLSSPSFHLLQLSSYYCPLVATIREKMHAVLTLKKDFILFHVLQYFFWREFQMRKLQH